MDNNLCKRKWLVGFYFYFKCGRNLFSLFFIDIELSIFLIKIIVALLFSLFFIGIELSIFLINIIIALLFPFSFSFPLGLPQSGPGDELGAGGCWAAASRAPGPSRPQPLRPARTHAPQPAPRSLFFKKVIRIENKSKPLHSHCFYRIGNINDNQTIDLITGTKRHRRRNQAARSSACGLFDIGYCNIKLFPPSRLFAVCGTMDMTAHSDQRKAI